ncbi:MAG: hypothetical protein ACRDNI_10270 [Gaiellaceae bacterium]
MERMLITVVVVATSMLVLGGPAYADDRRCAGTIGARTIDGNVIVPAGRTCRLVGTRVDDNVFVKANARLIARGVRVGGNIQAENHLLVRVIGRWVGGRYVRSRIGGDIQLFSGRFSEIRRAVIGGNLQSKQNNRRQYAVMNRIGADLQAFSNRNGYRIHRNVIDGNLQCKSNRPRPTGDHNRVQGNKEDQCRRM